MSLLILDRFEQTQPRGKAAGAGVSGIVIQARDTLNGNLVAIKRPNPLLSPVEKREKINEIEREAQALMRLEHQVICSLVDARSENNDYYLVILWANGNQLELRLRELERSGQLMPHGEAVEILTQAAEGLAYAHTRGVVHNDVDAKHLFWEAKMRQVTLIDWANCALDSDERPIATWQDDMHQFGELMHRVFTGTTLQTVLRLGQERGWRIELEDRKVDTMLQDIIARAVGRHDMPYQAMDELVIDLHSYRKKIFGPYQSKKDDVQRRIRDASLNRTAFFKIWQLIETIEAFDPSLVIRERQQVENAERLLDKRLAITRAQTAVLAGNGAEAQQRLVAVFGSDWREMTDQAQDIFWFAEMMTQAAAPDKIQQIAQNYFQEQPNYSRIFDQLLLGCSVEMLRGNGLVEKLYSQLLGQQMPAWYLEVEPGRPLPRNCSQRTIFGSDRTLPGLQDEVSNRHLLKVN